MSTLAYFFLPLAHYSEGCTVGNITQVTISDGSFPFGYDQTQFDLCLDIPVLKGKLYSICEKVDDDGFQEIILKKLNQVKFALVKNKTKKKNCYILFFFVFIYFFIDINIIMTLFISYLNINNIFFPFCILPGIPIRCVRWECSAAWFSVSCSITWWHLQVEYHQSWHPGSTHERWWWIMGGSKGIMIHLSLNSLMHSTIPPKIYIYLFFIPHLTCPLNIFRAKQ